MTKRYCDRCGAEEKNKSFSCYKLEGYSYIRKAIMFELCEKCEQQLKLGAFIQDNRGEIDKGTEKDIKDRLFEIIEEVARFTQEDV